MYFFRNPGGKAWISCSRISKANILNVKFWNCECTCVNITKKNFNLKMQANQDFQ